MRRGPQKFLGFVLVLATAVLPACSHPSGPCDADGGIRYEWVQPTEECNFHHYIQGDYVSCYRYFRCKDGKYDWDYGPNISTGTVDGRPR